jgi:hypothetical protein
MSDQSQGPGWWMASDNRWYPPHLHPDYVAPPPPPGPASPAALTPPASPPGKDPRSWARRNVAVLAAIAVGVVVVVALLAGTVATSDDDGPGGETAATLEPADRASGNDERAPTTSTTAVGDAAPKDSPLLYLSAPLDIPSGDPGELSVVLIGPVDRTSVPVVVRNRTKHRLWSIEVHGTARGADGGLLGSGSSQGFVPSVVEPGEWAFGYVYFGFDGLPTDAQLDLTATGSERRPFIADIDLTVSEVTVRQGSYSRQVVGIVSNGTPKEADGPISVDIACFTDSDRIADTHGGFTDGDEIPPGGTLSFAVDLYDHACPILVVGASGHDL